MAHSLGGRRSQEGELSLTRWSRVCAHCTRPEVGAFSPFTSLWAAGSEGVHGGFEVCRSCFLLCSIARIVGECDPATESVALRRVFSVLQLAYDVAWDLEVSHAAAAIARGQRRARPGPRTSEGPGGWPSPSDAASATSSGAGRATAPSETWLSKPETTRRGTARGRGRGAARSRSRSAPGRGRASSRG